MPAATPKPTLEELLIILSRVHHLEAQFALGKGLLNDPDTITLKYTFKREHLGPAAKVVFEYPSTIFSSLKEQLDFDDAMEKAFRATDPRNTISDVVSYLEQKIVHTKMLNGLSDRMDIAFYGSALKYLRELDRRRREADRREKEVAQARRKRDEEEIKRTVEEEIRRREQERQRTKEEARQRWEEEESRKRKWQQEKASDFGQGRSQYNNPFEEIFRGAGIDPNDTIFKEAFRKASYGGFGYGQDYSYGGNKSNRQSPPPPPNGKPKWFEVLRCYPAASRDEIRAAAREAAKGLHPDTSTDPQAKEKFQAISEAKAEGLKGCGA